MITRLLTVLALALVIRAAAGDSSDRIRTAQLIHQGVPHRATVVRIALTDKVQLRDPTGIRLQVPVRDPYHARIEWRDLPVMTAYTHRNEWVIQVAGPVSRGSRLCLSEQALTAGGRCEIELSDAKLPMPWEAALWFKPYRPVDGDFYAPGDFPRQAVEPSTLALAAQLRRHYQPLIAAGGLTADRAEELIARLDAMSENIPLGLQAAILSTAGGLFEPTIAILLDGDNPTGYPAVIEYGQLCCNEYARVFFTGEPRRMHIVVQPDVRFEPLPLVGLLLGHEAVFHQDAAAGRIEEVLANFAQYSAFAEWVLRNPAVLQQDSRLLRLHRKGLLAVLNSGGHFPRPGLLAAVGVRQVLPGQTVYAGFAESVEAAYAEVAKRSTPGNPAATRLLSQLLSQPLQPGDFTPELLRDIDRDFTFLSAEQVFTLLALLRVELAPSVN